MPEPQPGPTGRGAVVDVVGLHGGVVFGRAAREAVVGAEVLVGADRHLAAVAAATAEPVTTAATTAGAAGTLEPGAAGRASGSWWPVPGPVLDTVAERAAAGQRVCVLASGDPGFFGIVRLPRRAPSVPERLAVHPAPSSVALAFARLGLPGTTPSSSRPTAGPWPTPWPRRVRHPEGRGAHLAHGAARGAGQGPAAGRRGPGEVAVCSRLG